MTSIEPLPVSDRGRERNTMAIKLHTTRGASASSVKCLVYGQAGAGKTTLIRTLPTPVVISAEAGLLSLSDVDIPYITVASIDDIRDAYQWLTSSEEATQFASVAIDSLSEIAEVVLSTEKRASKDARAAYGEMQDQVASLVRSFRDVNKHIYFTAKAEKSQDQEGRLLWSPSMPGNKIGQQLPYFFDEVLALRVERDADGNMHRALLCDSDGLWQAKDRSGRLDTWEEPDLGKIISKVAS